MSRYFRVSPDAIQKDEANLYVDPSAKSAPYSQYWPALIESLKIDGEEWLIMEARKDDTVILTAQIIFKKSRLFEFDTMHVPNIYLNNQREAELLPVCPELAQLIPQAKNLTTLADIANRLYGPIIKKLSEVK